MVRVVIYLENKELDQLKKLTDPYNQKTKKGGVSEFVRNLILENLKK